LYRLTAHSTVRLDSDVIDRDDLGFNSSDDWGTPPPRRREQAANEGGGFSHSEATSITSSKFSSSSTLNTDSLTQTSKLLTTNLKQAAPRTRDPEIALQENYSLPKTKKYS
jgi:hypothetical protein